MFRGGSAASTITGEASAASAAAALRFPRPALFAGVRASGGELQQAALLLAESAVLRCPGSHY